MHGEQLILILSIAWIGGSASRSFQPTSFDYDYQLESRSVPMRQRGGTTSTTPRPLIQQYWQRFLKNLPALPQLRWNMTNSLGNLFTAGFHQIIETPVAMHYLTEEPTADQPIIESPVAMQYLIKEPHRKKTNSRRRTTKKNKNSQKLGLKLRNNYENSYHKKQLNLQPLGIDNNRVMHLYEPISDQFYALQIEPQPVFYNQYSQYNDYKKDDTYNDKEENDDSYIQHDNYEDKNRDYNKKDEVHNQDFKPHAGQSEPPEKPYGYEYASDANTYDNDNLDYYGDNHSSYEDDNVEVVDNWGYNDEEIFGDRKLKAKTSNLKGFAGGFIKIRKDLLTPETVQDVAKQLNTPTNKEDANKTNFELGRHVRGSRITGDSKTKEKQNVKTKHFVKLVKMPSVRGKFYVFPGNIFS